MNGDGSGVVRVTDNATNDIEPSFSADGKKVVFVSNRTGDNEIFVVGEQGTQQLSSNTFSDRQPKYSSNGKTIVFQSIRGGVVDLFLMDTDSQKESQVTTSKFTEDSASFESFDKIIFSSDMDNGIPHIYQSNLDGSQLKQIAINGTSNENFANLSPDKRHIVFVSNQPGKSDIYVLERATGSIKQLTSNAKNNVDPIYSSDGARIFFSSDRTGDYDIFSMNPDGSDVRNLTNDPATDRAPSVR